MKIIYFLKVDLKMKINESSSFMQSNFAKIGKMEAP